MSDIIPIFSSHFSLASSLLTLEEPTEYSETGPNSIFTLAKKYNINPVYIVDDSISGLIQGFQSAEKAQVNLRYGLKLVCCADINKKDEESLKSQHSLIIWVLNSQGIKDIYKISTAANTTGFYYTGRVDSKILKELMTENLMIGFPFFSSFLARNLLSFSTCMFDPSQFNCVFLREPHHDLPFNKLLLDNVDKYTKDKYEVVDCHTVLYEKKQDFTAFMVRKAIANRATLDAPKEDFLCSDSFSLESWKENNR